MASFPMSGLSFPSIALIENCNSSFGVEYFEKQSIDYSSELYALLEKYDEHVVLPVEDSIRSRMNVVFNFKNDKNEQAFIDESLDQNIIGINCNTFLESKFLRLMY